MLNKTAVLVSTAIVVATATSIIVTANGLSHNRCDINPLDKVHNPANDKRGTVRFVDKSTCEIGIMYDDNTVSKTLSANGGVKNTIPAWTVNKTR